MFNTMPRHFICIVVLVAYFTSSNAFTTPRSCTHYCGIHHVNYQISTVQAPSASFVRTHRIHSRALGAEQSSSNKNDNDNNDDKTDTTNAPSQATTNVPSTTSTPVQTTISTSSSSSQSVTPPPPVSEESDPYPINLPSPLLLASSIILAIASAGTCGYWKSLLRPWHCHDH
jgi:hypothetical protein